MTLSDAFLYILKLYTIYKFDLIPMLERLKFQKQSAFFKMFKMLVLSLSYSDLGVIRIEIITMLLKELVHK